ncbi:MAG: ABC transporter ATP-binding protein [Acidobacteriota bacterium]
MNAISVDRISKRFEAHVAVDGISFAVPRGTIYGLLGPNGAGKTTTLRMILGVLRPDSGTIRILGQDSNTAVIDRVGYLPEERGLYGKMKVMDHLVFLAEIKGVPRRKAISMIDHWLDRVGLSEWKNHKVQELSKGMQQKVQFVGTAIHKPDVLILDEPFSGLDPVNTNLLKDLVLEQNRNGTTVIFSTHIMEQVERLCSAICLIDRGRIMVEGPLARVKQRHGIHSVVLSFQGDGTFLHDLPEIGQLNLHGNYAEMRMRDDADPGAVLAAAVGRVRVRRFEIVEPTLNSIFLDLVGKGPGEDKPAGGTDPAAAAVGGGEADA